MSRGEDVNAADDSGETVLFQNCAYGNIYLLRFLITHGARVDICDKDGNTPLMYCFGPATGTELPAILKLLIAHGADVNQRNIYGETALTSAKRWEGKQIVRLLEAAGAKR